VALALEKRGKRSQNGLRPDRIRNSLQSDRTGCQRPPDEPDRQGWGLRMARRERVQADMALMEKSKEV